MKGKENNIYIYFKIFCLIIYWKVSSIFGFWNIWGTWEGNKIKRKKVKKQKKEREIKNRFKVNKLFV